MSSFTEEEQTKLELNEIYSKLGYDYMLNDFSENEIELLEKYILPIQYSSEKDSFTICSCGYITNSKNSKCFVCKKYTSNNYYNDKIETEGYYLSKTKEKFNTSINLYKKGRYKIKPINTRLLEFSYLKGKIDVHTTEDNKKKLNVTDLEEVKIQFIFKKSGLFVNYENEEMSLLKFMKLNNPKEPSKNIFKIIKEMYSYLPRLNKISWALLYDESNFWMKYIEIVYLEKMDKSLQDIFKKHKYYEKDSNGNVKNYLLNDYLIYLLNTNLINIDLDKENILFEDIFDLDEESYHYLDGFNLFQSKEFNLMLEKLTSKQKENLNSLIQERFLNKLNINYNLDINECLSILNIFLKKDVPITVNGFIDYVNHIETNEGLNFLTILKHYESYIKKTPKNKLLLNLYPNNLKLNSR